MMDEKIARMFLDEAARAFSPVLGGVFAPPTLEIDESIQFATVTFLGKNLALECILDPREEDIDCKVARVIDGRKTAHYAVDEHGTRVREGLAPMLRRKGVRGPLFRTVKGRSLEERIPITLEDFARMLAAHGADVLADSESALG